MSAPGQQASGSAVGAGPLAATAVVGAAPVLKEPRLHTGRLFWLEQLPEQQGRTTLRMRTPAGEELELTPELDLRSRIHGYGGGTYCLSDTTAVVVAEGGRSLWRLDLPACEGGTSGRMTPVPLLSADGTGEAGAGRVPPLYADGLIDVERRRWIGVCEQDGRDRLVAVPLEGGAPQALMESADFCGYAVLSPGGGHLAWVSWRQPCMPWDRSELWLGRLDAGGALIEARAIAGSTPGEGAAVSVFQPLWAGCDLVVANDRSGFWNLECLEDATGLDPGATPHWRPLLPMEAEFAMPQWVYGMRTTAWDGHRLLAAACREGCWQLGALMPGGEPGPAATAAVAAEANGLRAVPPQPATADSTPGRVGTARPGAPSPGLRGPLRWVPFPLPFDDLACLDAEDGRLVAIASAPTQGPGLLELDTARGDWSHRPAEPAPLAPEAISLPEPLWFVGHGGLPTHAWYYPPQGGEDGRSPLLVRGHSGPTAMARTGLSLSIQFWTSRGWGVVDVNYGGSTGFGRAYRERLDGLWGVVDVDDCLAAARALVEGGRADPDRIAMEGSSASGCTVLAAMARGDTLRAGAIRYPVTDLTTLAEGDHRFEARYFDGLVGPWPEARALYEQRSPLNQVERIHAPLLFFHGLDDAVVPAQQSIAMVERLRQRGVPVELELVEGEGHGFRDATVQRRVLERSEAFFRKRFDLPDPA